MKQPLLQGAPVDRLDLRELRCWNIDRRMNEYGSDDCLIEFAGRRRLFQSKDWQSNLACLDRGYEIITLKLQWSRNHPIPFELGKTYSLRDLDIPGAKAILAGFRITSTDLSLRSKS